MQNGNWKCKFGNSQIKNDGIIELHESYGGKERIFASKFSHEQTHSVYCFISLFLYIFLAIYPYESAITPSEYGQKWDFQTEKVKIKIQFEISLDFNKSELCRAIIKCNINLFWCEIIWNLATTGKIFENIRTLISHRLSLTKLSVKLNFTEALDNLKPKTSKIKHSRTNFKGLRILNKIISTLSGRKFLSQTSDLKISIEFDFDNIND